MLGANGKEGEAEEQIERQKNTWQRKYCVHVVFYLLSCKSNS